MRRRELGLAQHAERVEIIEAEFGEPLRDVITGMREQGCSWATVANVLEVSELTLQKWREQLGIPIDREDKVYEMPRGVKSDSDTVAEQYGYETIAELMYDWRVLQGMTKEEVANRLGVSVKTVYNWSNEVTNGNHVITDKARVASSQNAKFASQFSKWRRGG